MAKIFASHTTANDDWADWIGREAEALGFEVSIDHWDEVGNIAEWMYARMEAGDIVLCVCSEAYFRATFTKWELETAHWASVTEKKNLLKPIYVEACANIPRFLSPIFRCDLQGLDEKAAREALARFLGPKGRPDNIGFPPSKKAPVFPPDKPLAHSNVPLREPEHFLGRDNSLAEIEKNLAKTNGRVVVTALHGLRGVGKSTLAAVYAHKNRCKYRATWWIAAQRESTLRADLTGLGVAMKWIDKNEKEEAAVRTVLERLRDDGAGVLLIFDNANAAEEIRSYLPVSGEAKIIATSNSDDWLGLATPVEIDVWPKETGADFLVERTGRINERADALALSEALGGLPLAHEQAGAYCTRLKVSFADYLMGFEAAPVAFLDKERDAVADYHNRLTVAKSFTIAIEQASKLHPAAAPLIEYAALLAPEPIPLFFFLEGGKELGPPFDTLEAEGLDEAIAALRTFALVDRETIEDERDASIATETIRLHRLVRAVAAARGQGEAREQARRMLIAAMAAVYPWDVFDNYRTWPRARRLDAFTLELVEDEAPPAVVAKAAIRVLDRLAAYQQSSLGMYGAARTLALKALHIAEAYYAPDDPSIGVMLSNLGTRLIPLGGPDNLNDARIYLVRALAIHEKNLGPIYVLDPSSALG